MLIVISLSNGLNLGSAKLGVSGKLNTKNVVAVQLSQNLGKTSSPQLEFGVATQCNKNLSSKFKVLINNSFINK